MNIAIKLQDLYWVVKKIKIPIVILLLFAIIGFIFRDSLQYGMQFDEVFRVNNLIPLFNPNAYPYDQSIFDIHLFGISVPIMYKLYISSAYIFPFLPIWFFDNYLVGLRFLYFLYFFMSITGYFLIVSRYNFLLGIISSFLIATSPIFYPEIRHGFAYSWHIIFIALSIHLFYRYFTESRKPLTLFLAVFFLFLSANITLYSLWTIAAVILSSLMFFTKYWISVLSSLKNIITVIFGVFIGLFNHIIFNIKSGFPVLEVIYLKLFNLTEYNKNPIDFWQAKPLIIELIYKFMMFSSFFGGYFYLYILLTLAIIVIFIVSFYKIIKLNKIKEYKLYFSPLLTLFIIMVFILISPNTIRAGHYVYLIPFYTLTILSALFLMYRLFGKNRQVRLFVFVMPVLVFSLNFFVSNSEINQANKTNGTGHFSPAIYELKSYVEQNGIDHNDIVHIHWGLYTQLYFLNKGEININSIVFELIKANTKKAKFEVIKNFLKSPKNKMKDRLYFPIYTNFQKGISQSFFEYITSNGGNLTKIKTFYEKSGAEVFSLYKLENPKDLIESLNKG